MSLAVPAHSGTASAGSPARTARPDGLSRSASVIVTSRRPSLRHASGPSQAAYASRPITFALPPLAANGHGTSGAPGSPTSPSYERGNPLSASVNTSTSPSTSFLNRLSRKLSVGRGNLVRRVSKGTKTSPTASKTVSVHGYDKENRAGSEAALAPGSSPMTGEASAPDAPVTTRGGPSLQRGTMRRSKSEGKRAPRLPAEEQKMQELVARANGFAEMQVSGTGETDTLGCANTGKSYVGSFYWSDSLGVCWDGREEVRPDTTFAFQRYTSDADEVAKRAVFASTLSSFPPRPPLRPRTPELTPARQIIAEYRATHSPITPGTRSRSRALSDAHTSDMSPTPRTRGHALTPLAMDNLPQPPSRDGLPINPFESAPQPLSASSSCPSPMSPSSVAAAHAAHSYASSSASSFASGAEERFRFGTGSETSAAAGAGRALVLHAPSRVGLGAHERADSATSLESMGLLATGATAAAAGKGSLSSPAKLRAPTSMQRFQLVDDGPVPKPTMEDAASSVLSPDEWKDCE